MSGAVAAKRGAASRAAVQDTMRRAVSAYMAHQRFADRGFSNATIDALANAGVDYPERLLMMEEKAIERLPGIGKAKLQEIKRYVLNMREGDA
jgi:DNA-directed RNA polymerase alpha subunit